MVIPLRGWKKTARFASNNPHCGVWGKDTWYILLPSKRPSYTAGAILAFDTGLDTQTTDAEVLVRGYPAQILALITKGPKTCLAYTRRKLAPEHKAKLIEVGIKHRFNGSGDQMEA